MACFILYQVAGVVGRSGADVPVRAAMVRAPGRGCVSPGIISVLETLRRSETAWPFDLNAQVICTASFSRFTYGRTKRRERVYTRHVLKPRQKL